MQDVNWVSRPNPTARELFEIFAALRGYAADNADKAARDAEWGLCAASRARVLLPQFANSQDAEIVRWQSDIFDAAIRGYRSWLGVPYKPPEVPTPRQFWYFNFGLVPGGGLKFFDLPAGIWGVAGYFAMHTYGARSVEDGWVDAAQLTGRRGIVLCIIFGDANPDPTAEGVPPIFRFLHPLWEGGEIQAQYAEYAALSEFMRLEIVGREAMPFQRAYRRAAARRNVELPEVSTVVLRRIARPASDLSSPRHVDWQHQWLVKGHWRRQFHPSTGEHRPKFIQPYVKGPEDRPLKAPREAVYVVKR